MNYKNTSELMTAIKASMVYDHVSQKELAIRMNLTPSAISNRLNRDQITFDKILEICDALNYDLDIEIKKRQ